MKVADNAAANIDSRIAGKDPTVAKPIFTLAKYQAWPAAIFERNTSCWAAEHMADIFDVSVGEMACTSILVAATGYSWRQWCLWPDWAENE